jgi:hypothetical protein
MAKLLRASQHPSSPVDRAESCEWWGSLPDQGLPTPTEWIQAGEQDQRLPLQRDNREPGRVTLQIARQAPDRKRAFTLNHVDTSMAMTATAHKKNRFHARPALLGTLMILFSSSLAPVSDAPGQPWKGFSEGKSVHAERAMIPLSFRAFKTSSRWSA